MTLAQHMIDRSLAIAARSPCRSKRGVTLHDMRTGAFRGGGFNGPPALLPCAGREKCAGNCGQRCVHAEVRALRDAAAWEGFSTLTDIDLIHVEIDPGGGVLACDGPRCPSCAAQVLDVGFVKGVWLYLGVSRCLACRRFEDSSDAEERYKRCPECGADLTPAGVWSRYSANEFYRVTLQRCGMKP
jgi:deoxycytidylate deaminase